MKCHLCNKVYDKYYSLRAHAKKHHKLPENYFLNRVTAMNEKFQRDSLGPFLLRPRENKYLRVKGAPKASRLKIVTNKLRKKTSKGRVKVQSSTNFV